MSKPKCRPTCRLCGKLLKHGRRHGGVCSRCNSYGGPGPYRGPEGHGGPQSKLMSSMPGRDEKILYYAERAAAHLPLFT